MLHASKIFAGDTAFTVAVKPELAIGEFVPWCVEVDGAWYEVGRYYTEDSEPPRSADRFIRNNLKTAHSERGPSWLANYEFPLLLNIDGKVVRCRAQSAMYGDGVYWVFEYDGSASRGGVAGTEDTIDDVRDLAHQWIEARPT